MSLPGADLLFRPSAEPVPEPYPPSRPEPPEGDGASDDGQRPHRASRQRSSGRQRHDEKITVYVSADELLEIERARLALRAEHGIVADRGRLVREAVAVLLADFGERGEESTLVRRLGPG